MADHHHHHHHDHSVPANAGRAFILGIILNSAFVLIEAVIGLWTHSLGLLTDAGHNLSDVASLALALFATRLAVKKSHKQYTFGFRQATVLVALVNAVILLLALGAISYEAIIRMTKPHMVEGRSIALVAAIGIVINAATALLFLKGKEKDLNVKGAYLHMAADALVSLGVVIAGVIIIYTQWYWLDSAVSLVIVVVIVYGTWGLLRESLRLTLNAAPKDVDLERIRNYFLGLKGVKDLHDLHVWAISTTEIALTVHLVMPDGLPDDNFYHLIQEDLHHSFNINHPTVQVERSKMDFDCG